MRTVEDAHSLRRWGTSKLRAPRCGHRQSKPGCHDPAWIAVLTARVQVLITRALYFAAVLTERASSFTPASPRNTLSHPNWTDRRGTHPRATVFFFLWVTSDMSSRDPRCRAKVLEPVGVPTYQRLVSLDLANLAAEPRSHARVVAVSTRRRNSLPRRRLKSARAQRSAGEGTPQGRLLAILNSPGRSSLALEPQR